MDKMQIAVIGAGAVGGYFGAKLAASGQDVSFVARGKHLEAMRQNGLEIKSSQGNFRVQSLFAANPGEVGPVDLILFCVKSYDTEKAAAALGPLMKETTRILSLQNGIDNPDKIAALWGKDRTLAGVVYIGARLAEPRVIEHSAGGRIVFGELDGQIGVETNRVHELFSDAQVPCVISTEIRKAMWEKLVWNGPFCALSCLARATVKEIMESDSLRQLALDCMEEIIDAARSQSIDIGVSAIDEAMNLSRSIGDFKPSMLQDLEAAKPLEYEAFNGVVVSRLRQAGKKAPINESFYALLQFLDKKIRADNWEKGTL